MRSQAVCQSIQGDLPIQFRWSKNGLPIDPVRDQLTVHEQGFSSSLVFEPLLADHSDNYTCEATNSAGQDSHTARLVVQVPPHWVEEPRDLVVLAGEPVTLVCAATGQPPPNITWIRVEGEGREGSEVVTMQVEGAVVWGRVSLARADSGAGGQYSCSADNGVGVALARTVRLAVNSPPVFVPAEEQQEAEAGSGLKLRCQVQEGDRPLHYRWTREGRPLQLSSR